MTRTAAATKYFLRPFKAPERLTASVEAFEGNFSPMEVILYSYVPNIILHKNLRITERRTQLIQ